MTAHPRTTALGDGLRGHTQRENDACRAEHGRNQRPSYIAAQPSGQDFLLQAATRKDLTRESSGKHLRPPGHRAEAVSGR
jgi:hypothetical protein